jgi:hypothetical protein
MNARRLLQNMSLNRVEDFFIADVGPIILVSLDGFAIDFHLVFIREHVV